MAEPSGSPSSGDGSKRKARRSRGRDRRVRLPGPTASAVFQITQRLGHRNDGETIAWLLREAAASVFAAGVILPPEVLEVPIRFVPSLPPPPPPPGNSYEFTAANGKYYTNAASFPFFK